LTAGQAELILADSNDLLDGTITNDKFCMTRLGRLRLTWWRRPLQSRPTSTAVSGYPPDETSRRGGSHETSVEHPQAIS
jgi:hypothetical protein